MRNSAADAFVFFGATGDLAYKQIFPALQALVRRGHLDVPIIGVAKSGWGIEQLTERARQSLEKHGGVDNEAFERLCSLLRYIDGDYVDPSTYEQLCTVLGDAARPLYYLAIPPSMFATVVHGLVKSGCTREPRVVVEKPFGRDLASARVLAERLRAHVQNLAPGPDNIPACTLSIGVATVQPTDTQWDTVLTRSDQALYQAKAAGRNRVEVG